MRYIGYDTRDFEKKKFQYTDEDVDEKGFATVTYCNGEEEGEINFVEKQFIKNTQQINEPPKAKVATQEPIRRVLEPDPEPVSTEFPKISFNSEPSNKQEREETKQENIPVTEYNDGNMLSSLVWEYITLNVEFKDIDTLNKKLTEAGLQAWELCGFQVFNTILGSNYKAICVFKRIKEKG